MRLHAHFTIFYSGCQLSLRGYNNFVNSVAGAIVGGTNNFVKGDYGFVGGGDTNSALGFSSIIVGGEQSVTGPDASYVNPAIVIVY